MVKYAVVKTGGKQYLVKENDIITVDQIEAKPKDTVSLDCLMTFDNDGKEMEIGAPLLKKVVKAEVLSQLKGDKIRVARFKSKVRYRKVKGFRPYLTTLKILKV